MLQQYVTVIFYESEVDVFYLYVIGHGCVANHYLLSVML